MVLPLFFLTLAFASSWQEEITEKSLDQMLDQLIEETVLTTYSNENENNSRIIYIKQDNLTRRNHDVRLDTIHSNEFKDLQDLVNQIENSNYNENHNHVSSELRPDNEAQEGRTGGGTVNDGMNNDNFKSHRLLEETSNKILVLPSDSENNIYHKYPEIIIDKISYDVVENVNEPKVATVIRNPTVKLMTNEEKSELTAKAIDSLVKILMKGAQIGKRLDVSKEKEADDINNIQRSTHIHNAYHNHVISNVPLSYNELLPGEKVTLGKLPEGYRDLHRTINRLRSAYLNPNLQLSRWGGNAVQSPVMSILRAHNRNRVHFIPESLNIMPRIVYGPLFRRKYPN